MAERQRIDIMKGVDPNALYNVAMELAETYQQLLASEHVNASGELSRAAKSYIFRWKGDVLMLTFRLPEYWYYIEHGRNRTTGVTGKAWADPVGDIMRWIDAKKLTPTTQMRSARVPKTRKPVDAQTAKRRMAEAIVHKIHREGFYSPNHHGKHLMEKAIMATKIKERLVGILVDAYGEEIRVELADVVNSLNKQKT